MVVANNMKDIVTKRSFYCLLETIYILEVKKIAFHILEKTKLDFIVYYIVVILKADFNIHINKKQNINLIHKNDVGILIEA